jgi:hypothetical protein
MREDLRIARGPEAEKAPTLRQKRRGTPLAMRTGMPRLLLLVPLLSVLGWTAACVELPEVVDPPAETPDSGTSSPPDSGPTPPPDAGPAADAGGGPPDAGPDAGPVDVLRPILLNISPMEGATEVPTGAQLLLTFSEPMDTDSVQVGVQPSVALGVPVWSQQGTVLRLQPTGPLAENTTYTVTVDGEDVAGNPLTGTRAFSFTTTGPAPDTTPPTVLSTSPSQASIGNARNALLEVVFSEPMNRASVQAAFSITSPAGLNGGSFSWNEAATVMTYVPPTSFAYGTEVSWQVSTGARDAAGNALAETVLRGFRVIRQGTLTVRFDPETSGSVGAPTYLRQTTFYNSAYLGDDFKNETHRLFLGFKLDGLPENLSVISQATLRWWMTSHVGSPLSKFGILYLEPVNVGSQIGTAPIDEPPNPDVIADYQVSPLSAGVPILPSVIGAPGVIDVTQWVATDWSARTARDRRTQYRLRFERASDNDSMTDALISDSETHPTLAELHIIYEHP